MIFLDHFEFTVLYSGLLYNEMRQLSTVELCANSVAMNYSYNWQAIHSWNLHFHCKEPVQRLNVGIKMCRKMIKKEEYATRKMYEELEKI